MNEEIAIDPGPRGENLTMMTTLPLMCTRCKGWFVAFKSKFSSWHASMIPAPPDTTQVSSLKLSLAPDLQFLSKSFPHTLNTSKCRTQKPSRLADLIRGLRIDVESLEIHGGMGRIYALKDPDKVLKVTDVARGWCKYERSNYTILQRLHIPCAVVYTSVTRRVDDTVYVLSVMERLEFTMTAFIRAAGRANVHPHDITAVLKSLLQLLRQHDLVYCDLSPDNIMFRRLDDHEFQIALIDPQFMVSRPDFRNAMSRQKADAFDTTYLALKVQAIGMLDHVVHKFTDAVCAGILGHVPLEKYTKRWLLHEAPIGLFMAYDILRKK
jgi:hypothetical protein